jgi:hypothetical protein
MMCDVGAAHGEHEVCLGAAQVKLYWLDGRMLTARRPMLPIASGEARTLGETRTRLATWMPRLILLAAGAYFVVMAGRWIASPGLEYDELMFVNAATGEATNGMFVRKRILGIPALIMGYTGALKGLSLLPHFPDLERRLTSHTAALIQRL